MKKYVVFIFTILSYTSQSQTLKEFKYLGDEYGNNYYVGAAYSMSFVSNPVVTNPNSHQGSDRFAELNLKRHDFDLKGFRYDLDVKLYWDLIRITSNLVQGDWGQYYRSEVTGFSTGLTGWHNVGWNIFASDRITIAPGLNHQDYFYSSSVRSSNDLGKQNPELITAEPQGYYFCAGPTLFSDVLLNQWMVLHLKTTYSIAYWKSNDVSYAIKDPSYPMPHFWGISAELTSPWGVFIELDHNSIINRGELPNKGRRTDVNIGFKFVVD